jgi:hypothetical protein
MFEQPDNLPGARRVALHLFITEHHEIAAVPAHGNPAGNLSRHQPNL